MGARGGRGGIMTRPKRRYHATVSYYDMIDGVKTLNDAEELTLLAVDDADAESRLNLKFKIGDNPKVNMYDCWEYCIEKY